MKFEIKNRWTGAVIFTAEIECAEDTPTSIKLGLAVRVAVKAGAYLTGAYLAGAYLAGANLTGAYLTGAYLADANLAGAYLTGANLAGAYLTGANLAGAYLAGAYLAGAYLADANLADAYLTGAYLAGAYLTGANLADANLAGANLAGANLAGAKNIEGVKWDYEGKQKTTVPPVFFLGATWPVFITDKHISIGCQIHTTSEWEAFTDREIAAMDGTNAARFWKQWKTAVLALAKAHQDEIKETK